MFRMKTTDQLAAWRQDPRHKPVILKGCRYCGKTYAVQEFAAADYESSVYASFFEGPEAKDNSQVLSMQTI